MADDLPIPSSRLPASEVAQRSFSTARRGFDPDEVLAFLELVSGELRNAEKREQELLHELSAAEDRARHPSLDEAMLTAALGEKSAAVLRHAHEEAARLTQQAEEGAAGLLRDAHQQATEVEVRAESAAAERIAEAELAANAMRQEARDESSAMRESARAEDEQIVARARDDARAIIEQAKEERRLVLADMARRRRAVSDQVEQFRAARDEIASSVTGVRDSVDRVMDSLRRADGAATATAAAAAAVRMGDGSDPAEVPGGFGEREAVVAKDAERDTTEDREPVEGDEESDEEPDEEPDGEPAEEIEVSADDAEGSADGAEGSADAEGSAAEVEEAAEGVEGSAAAVEEVVEAAAEEAVGRPAEGGQVRARRVALRFDDIASVVEPPRITPRPAPVPDRGPDDRVDVEGLFARLRSREEPAVKQPDPSEDTPKPADAVVTADGGADAVVTADGGGDEAVAADGGGDEAVEGDGVAAEDAAAPAEPSPEEAAMARRSSALDPIVTTMARRLKRALQDDQNRLLDRLRQGTGGWSDDLLPDEAAQRAQYVKAAAGQVRESLAAGISFARSSIGGRQGRAPVPDQKAVEAISDDLATTVVTLLRRRLEGADAPDVAERIGAAYREWRGERIERLAEDRVIEAFGTGVLVAAGRAGGVRWVRSEVDGGCADCEDNALAGRIEIGEKFPTGHRHPPAHAGCRCLVLPTPS